jgi:hypothetical protein
MNERIRLLAEQAGHKPLGTFADELMDIYNKKFAELIVAECLEACNRANEIRHLVPPTQEQVVLSCMREIENTFRS